MNVASAMWLNASATALEAVIDGDTVTVPALAGNRHFDAVLASGVTIKPPLPPQPSADTVRAEAARRMKQLVGARDGAHLAVKIANASREAIRLLSITAERPWTADEAARAKHLRAMDAMIEAIRSASNALEADPPPDIADDRHWPAGAAETAAMAG